MQFKSLKKHKEQLDNLLATLKKRCGYVSLHHKSASNTLRTATCKENTPRLDLSKFNSILEFNAKEHWIVVEPRLTFSELCRFTLKYGLIPPVVPEFTTITVGGAVMGAALESSSHKYGQVSDNTLEYELVLGDGTLIIASPGANSDLFYALSGSYGTLAILTAIKLTLIPSKPYVHLTYQDLEDTDAPLNLLTTSHPDDFVEGIVFSPSRSVIIRGNMVEAAHGPIFRQNRPWSPWYAQHVESSARPSEEYMPIYEYLFRHDRGAFWIGRYILSLKAAGQILFRLGIPQLYPHPPAPSFLLRFLLGWMFASKKLYQLWHRVPSRICENLFFIHDFYAPFSKAKVVFDRFMHRSAIFPIWLCPIKGTRTPQFLSPHHGSDYFLNIGLYGIPLNCPSIPELTASFEKEIADQGGRKMLYSFTYYDKAEFERLYEGERYHLLRKKYFADAAFPPLHSKITQRLG